MNLRTADRLRVALKILHLLVTIAALWIALATGFRLQKAETRLEYVEDINARQTYTLFLFAEAIDRLLQVQPGPNIPQLPPLLLPPPEPQRKLLFNTSFREQENSKE